MRRIKSPVLNHENILRMLHSLMSAEQREYYQIHWELDFAYALADIARFRINAFHQHRGAAAVFRSIPNQIRTLDAIQAPAALQRICQAQHGLILVTGPTGSGKSTTLAAMAHHKNATEYKHLLTIEDPIEYIHQPIKCLVNQREIARDTQTFASALRSALREDPDIILVGEMRDPETIRLALTAAETGHLVLATLHTHSAPKAVDRIIDVFQSGEQAMVRSMLSESLHAIVAQTLLKRQGGGRIAAYEILLGTPAIRHLIRENKVAQIYSTLQTSQAQGMQTLDQATNQLIREGFVSPSDCIVQTSH